MEGEPPDKKARTFDKNKCIICFNSLAKLKGNDKVVRNPTIQGLTTILDIARVKNDAVYDALFPLEDQIKVRCITWLFSRPFNVWCTAST